LHVPASHPFALTPATCKEIFLTLSKAGQKLPCCDSPGACGSVLP